MKNRLENIIIVVVLIILFLPIIQSYIPFVKEKELKGYFELHNKPVLSDTSYFSGSFQEDYMNYLNDHLPLKATITRINNQINYSIYNSTNVNDIVIGKKGYLYEYSYIGELNGEKFIGNNINNVKVRQLEKISDYLNQINKKLIIVFAPGKASFFPEFIPDILKKKHTDSTNYFTLKRSIQNSKLSFIDFRDYFVKMKDSTNYTLFSKTGIHWSQYGAHKASDSIVRFMEKVGNIDIVDKKYLYNEITTKPRGEDDDIAKSMNLLWDPPTNIFTYPVVEYSKENKYKPRVSVVADSYWWTINNIQIPHNQFSEYYFMYYYKHTYDFRKELSSEVSDENLKKYIENSDFIILMSTEANFNWFPYGFIEHFNRLYLQK